MVQTAIPGGKYLLGGRLKLLPAAAFGGSESTNEGYG